VVAFVTFWGVVFGLFILCRCVRLVFGFNVVLVSMGFVGGVFVLFFWGVFGYIFLFCFLAGGRELFWEGGGWGEC